MQFRRALAGDKAAEPSEIKFTRQAGAKSATHTIEFSTGPTPLPASLCGALWPGVEQLGGTSSFVGRVSAVEKASEWNTVVQGRLHNVDLDLLVSRRYPHKLSGLAEVTIKQATIHDGRLETAAGHMTAGPGVVSRSLVRSAETHLHVQAAPQAIAGPGNLIEYQAMCLGFEVGPQGLALHGEVPRTQGALLVDARRELVTEPPVISQPVVGLVRTLVPHSDMLVPATRETLGLTNTLPVPSIMPQPASEAPLPQARPLSVKPRTNSLRR